MPPAGTGCALTFPVVSQNGFYSVDVNIPAGGATFLLTATPQNGQAGDTGCGNLTLDNLNTRDRTGTKTVAECWGK